jgi:A/G-specific adenine glycosylase
LGYNRRAIALKHAAEQVAEHHGGQLPQDEAALRALPGIGPATAAGILAFAFGRPTVYLETNVRTVFLHELFADSDNVPDREIAPLVEASVFEAQRQGIDAREWYYALLDYGAHLKRTQPNPSRRSAHHTRQSKFEGSRRQKRAWLLRAVMAEPGQGTLAYSEALGATEVGAGRKPPSAGEVESILTSLAEEGFLSSDGDRWFVA